MLRFVGVAGVVPCRIEIDMYVAVDVVFGQWYGAPLPAIYWRRGDFIHSLMELGVAPRSGVIRSVTLTLPGHVSWDPACCPPSGAPDQAGVPVFDVAGWPESGFRDEPGQLDVCVSEDRIRMTFSPMAVSQWVVCGRVRFGVNQDSDLAAVEVTNLAQDDMRTLREAFH